MDVRIEVSLLGGHSWSFVCDENDPLVFGLVSALPGVGVDSSLPSDGLIQIERKSGDRIYFTRSSLVSVAVFRDPSGSALENRPAVDDVRQSGGTPEPVGASSVVTNVFGMDAIASLRALPPKPGEESNGSDSVELDDTGANPQISDDLIKLATAVQQKLAIASTTETMLLVDFFEIGPGETKTFEGEQSDIVWFLAAVPEVDAPDVKLDVSISNHAAIGKDGACAEAILLTGNSAYFRKGGQFGAEVRVAHSSAGQSAILVRGSVRAGA